MDKVLGLIIAVSVLMFTALTVMMMAQTSLVDMDQSSESMKDDSVCSFQTDQAEETGSWEDVDDKCLNDQHVAESQEDEAIAGKFKAELTS